MKFNMLVIKRRYNLSALALCFSLFFIIFCFNSEADTIRDQEYNVYSAVMSSKEPLLCRAVSNEEDLGFEQIVIQQLTLSLLQISHGDNVCTQFNNLSGVKLTSDLCQDFLDNNKGQYKLENNFSMPEQNIILISTEGIRAIFSANGGWNNFYEKYPDSGGMIGFSRVGFNNEQTHAFLYYHYLCGELCGRGVFVLLFKENSDWKIKRIQQAWRP